MFCGLTGVADKTLFVCLHLRVESKAGLPKLILVQSQTGFDEQG